MSQEQSKPSFNSFAEFWDYYLSQHQNRVNQVLHAAGTIGGILCIGLALCVSWKWALAIIPVGYGAAWLGHLLIEHNRPVTLRYPLWSLRADYRMVFWMICGRSLQTTQPAESKRRAA